MNNENETHYDPHHLLIIEFEFRNFVEDMMGTAITEHEAKKEGIPNHAIITEATEFVSTVRNLANADIENSKKCIAFINRKFPHVVYSYDDNGININNLSEEQMEVCSREPGLNFTYYLIDDQDPTQPADLIKINNQLLENQQP